MQKSKWTVPITIVLLMLIVIVGAFSKDRRREPVTPQEPSVREPVSYCGMTVFTPLPYTKITLPITVEAVVANTPEASCRWTVFEAQAGTVRVLNAEGEEVGFGILATTEDWMTTAPVSFSAPIALSQPVAPGENLVFIITEDDPSGGEAGPVDEIHISVEVSS